MRFVRRNLYGLTDETVEQLDLVTNVKGFNLRYFDGQANVWTDEWDGRGRSGPPAVVLIELIMKKDNEEMQTFRQWVSVGVQS